MDGFVLRGLCVRCWLLGLFVRGLFLFFEVTFSDRKGSGLKVDTIFEDPLKFFF